MPDNEIIVEPEDVSRDGRQDKEHRYRRGKYRRRMHYRGRVGQIIIYLGKFLRMFIYQNDWKVFPISILIAGLLAYVIRNDFMRTMEGTLKGAFAVSCVALWNGCFNSIQVICREREIIKREHRTGMHISSYIIAHMIYQGLLCIGQSILMLYVFKMVGIYLPKEGMITRWFLVDLGITIFLITYAADMLALLISAVVKSTTSAMTVMPFILIFQLVFSGGIFALPAWTQPLTNMTISSYGLTCITVQADYNSLPMVSGWQTLKKMKGTDIEGTITVDEILALCSEETAQHSDVIRELRQMPAGREGTVAGEVTIGEVIDWAARDPELEEVRKKEYSGSVSIGDVIDIFGEDEVKRAVTAQSAKAGQNMYYEKTIDNVIVCWGTLIMFSLLYAALAIFNLEFVDKDRR